jgi:hypothetical protein
MMEPSTQAQELPPELAQRLHRLAAAEMSESRPWPGVDNAVRRLHRRRVAGISAVAASCAVIIGVTFSSTLGLSSDRSQPAPPAGPQTTATATAPASPPSASGYAGPVGGSLAGDQKWLKDVRAKVIRLSIENARNRPTKEFLVRDEAEDEVQVLWTSDVNEFRYAFVVYPVYVSKSKKPGYASALLSGPAGAQPDQLRYEAESEPRKLIDSQNTSKAVFLSTRRSSTFSDLVLICAPPTVTKVEVASTREFIAATGDTSTQYRSLSREGGAVWVGKLTHAEAYLSELQLTGRDGYSSNNARTANPTERRASWIAPEGSDLIAANLAGSALKMLGPSLEEQAVFTATRRFSSTGTFGATVFRSPEGVALLGFVVYDLKYPARSSKRDVFSAWIEKQPLGDPDTFMTAHMYDQDKGTGYIVIAPVGATSARIGKVTVPVDNRLAYFGPGTYRGSVSVQALNAQGKVIATVKSQE